MKNKKVVSLVAAAALLANLVLGAAAFAATSGSQEMRQIVAGLASIDEVPTADVLDLGTVNSVTLLTQDVITNRAGTTESFDIEWTDTRDTSTSTTITLDLTTNLTDTAADGDFINKQTNVQVRGQEGSGGSGQAMISGSTGCDYTEADWTSLGASGVQVWVGANERRTENCRGYAEYRTVLDRYQNTGTYVATMTFTIA